MVSRRVLPPDPLKKVLSFEDFEKFERPLPPVLKKFAMLHRGLVMS